jgi:hypothetical protein
MGLYDQSPTGMTDQVFSRDTLSLVFGIFPYTLLQLVFLHRAHLPIVGSPYRTQEEY